MASAAFDICVIGAGSGGLSVAAAAAEFGQSVVLIESGKMGGDCLNYGCVPSKSLIAAARHAHTCRNGAAFGIEPRAPKIDFGAVHEHVHGVIAAIAPHDSQARFEKLGVRVIRDRARFTGADAVEVAGETIRARRYVIATGSSPAAPPIEGLESVPYLTNESLFDLETLPAKLIIIGGGPIGMEMAQAFCRLGSEVTVLEAATPLGNDDPELAGVVLDGLRTEGVEIVCGIKVSRVRKQGNGVEAEIEENGSKRKIAGTHLLVAAGRKANVADLGLEAAGIEYSDRGVAVDKSLRTSNRKVYAVGDAAGGMQFTHVAGYHAGLVVRSILFRLPTNAWTGHIPRVTYTDPELAQVGLTEEEAGRRMGARTLRWSFSENDRAQTERDTRGLIKTVVSDNGKILGAGIVGPQAGDLIQPWGLAIANGLKIKSMIDQVVAYPTRGEVSRRAAITYYGDLPRKPWVRRLIETMKLFG